MGHFFYYSHISSFVGLSLSRYIVIIVSHSVFDTSFSKHLMPLVIKQSDQTRLNIAYLSLGTNAVFKMLVGD